ncbi:MULTISPECIES: SRPBCC domain-containing protein [unclassified Shinella]|uniref:SRPBCC domain-containing protein n=1 Tax=unclassified Shinella TaxID=2643062 RepID=UPI00234E8301|nr:MULTISPECIES: SRPBCC domain-containing protein [unclassified Shinella]MCO5150174.1 SRPBCC domain-containing protein [Shinella sp.]MDC7261121.1 SRPBCC domain-containing protein [Shinella sp. HY16]MDC7268016.1 SRPBCC domain-containing protein [Shinella sp. YZ44]
MNMTDPKIIHGSFTLDRLYDAPVAKVFAAYVEAEARYRWLISSDGWTVHEYRPAGRVAAGAQEFSKFSPPGADVVLTNETTFLEVREGECVILAYAMTLDGAPLSASLLTAEFQAEGGGTRLLLTEQGAYRDGNIEGRKEGTRGLLEQLAREVAASVAA